MANLIIQSFDVLSEAEAPLPQDDNGVFSARFNPVTAQLRFSNKLYLALECDVLNASSQPIQGYFRMLIMNADEYDFFEYGNPGEGEARYFKQLRSGDTVFLPFRIKNRRPFGSISNAQIRIIARDAVSSSSPISTRLFRIARA
jgi:hypothetical protein